MNTAAPATALQPATAQQPTPAQHPATDLPIAANVLLAGRVVGRSEFETGRPTYMVEYTVRGKPHRDWFFASELDEEAADNE